MSDIQDRKRARGLDRAFDILDHLRSAGRPMRPADLAHALGAPKSTIYDLVSDLQAHGMLEPVGAEGAVFLGRKLYLLGLAYTEHFDLTREARQALSVVTQQTHETAQFCMLDGNKYTVALMHEGMRPFRISLDVGKKTAIPWTASGRLLVGHLSDAEILALIPDGDFTLPNGARLPVAEFLAQVRRAFADGFFSFDSIVDTFTHCFAAAVMDGHGRCIATVCLVAPKADAVHNYDAYRQVLLAQAAYLSERATTDTHRA